MSDSTKWETFLKALALGTTAIGIMIVALIPIIAAYILYASSIDIIPSLAFLLGGVILACGYYHLVYVLPRMAKDIETRLSMEALRVSFWLVIFGLIIIILGFLYLMNLLPPFGWRT
jgi:hypothetical protein